MFSRVECRHFELVRTRRRESDTVYGDPDSDGVDLASAGCNSAAGEGDLPSDQGDSPASPLLLGEAVRPPYMMCLICYYTMLFTLCLCGLSSIVTLYSSVFTSHLFPPSLPLSLPSLPPFFPPSLLLSSPPIHSHREIHPSESLGLVEHNRTCVLHMPHSSQLSSNAHPPTYDAVVDLEAPDTSSCQEKVPECVCGKIPAAVGDQDRAVSTTLLPDGKHSMTFDFPWERPRPAVEGTEFQPSSPLAPRPPPSNDQPLRDVLGAKGSLSVEENEEVIANAHAGLDRGEEVGAVVRRNKSKDTVVQITMEDGEEGDQGLDKGERRKMANEKWKHRKTLMDIELQRLKHSQKNAERARRHSGVFMHQAFETPNRSPKQRGRTQTFSAGVNSTRVRNSLADARAQPRQKKSRSMSMQVERNELTGAWSGLRNLLNPHIEVTEEDEEEEEQEEAGLGLPPKDVPFFEEKPALSSLDMSQIPMEEIAMIGGVRMENSGHWNIDACQDSPF